MHDLRLPDVQGVNVNHRASWQAAISRHFDESFRKAYVRSLIFSILTCGVYAYKKYKKAKYGVAQALAARKLSYFRMLQQRIEEIRRGQTHLDPRQSLNGIFMQVQSEKVGEGENGLEFKAIYSPNEILLFITNPVRDEKTLKFHRLKSKSANYLKLWRAIKKKGRTNQYCQIQNINAFTKTLKQERCLTREGIHDRLKKNNHLPKKILLFDSV
jgi:hypothetical protein